GRMREGSRGSNLPLPSRQSQRNALSPKAGVLAAAAYEQRHRAGERGLSFKNPQNQFMMTRRRRQRNSLPEIDFVAVKNYRRAPAESESKNDIDNVEDHLALRSRRWIPRRKKHQVERDVDCICVSEVHRIAAHPPDPGRINQQNNSQQRPKDRVRCAAQPFAKKDQARGRTLEMKWLQDVAQCENCVGDLSRRRLLVPITTSTEPSRACCPMLQRRQRPAPRNRGMLIRVTRPYLLTSSLSGQPAHAHSCLSVVSDHQLTPN